MSTAYISIDVTGIYGIHHDQPDGRLLPLPPRRDLGLVRRLREVCRKGYEALHAQALWLAENGFPDEARDKIGQALALVTLMVLAPERGPAIMPGPIRSVAIVADLGLHQCRLYRVEQKRDQLKHLGIRASVFDFHQEIGDFLSSLNDFDAIIFYRDARDRRRDRRRAPRAEAKLL